MARVWADDFEGTALIPVTCAGRPLPLAPIRGGAGSGVMSVGNHLQLLRLPCPPAAQVAEGGYEFHPAISQVSRTTLSRRPFQTSGFRSIHSVIDEVKMKSGLGMDGDPLVNCAFGFENQAPVIQFNNLQSDAERDEQKGIMFLLKGIVGLRNSKAHSNRLFNDPRRSPRISRDIVQSRIFVTDQNGLLSS